MIEVKNNWNELVEQHHRDRWVSLKSYELKINQEEALKLYQPNEELESLLADAKTKVQNASTYRTTTTNNLADKTKTVAFDRVFKHDLAFADTGASLVNEPPFTKPPEKYGISAGAIATLADGRIVITQPMGKFAGYFGTFPKGHVDEGEAMQQTAFREVLEESGLKVQITGIVGDYRSGHTLTRYYKADVIGGDPGAHDWETLCVNFVPPDKVVEDFFRKNRRPILQNVFYDMRDEKTTIFKGIHDLPWYLDELRSNWRWLDDYQPKKSCEVALSNMEKNRAKQAIPFDENRVVLENGDFINASHIKLKRSYIAAQGPQEHTTNDFWQMAFEQAKEKEGLIVMVTDPFQEGKVKCSKYWPELIATYGSLTVKTLEVRTEGNLTRRKFEVTDGQSTRTINQLHQEHWQDRGLISEEELRMLVNAMGKEVTPIVHCSRGQGRTGVVILADALMGSEDPNPVAHIKAMREQRMWLCPALDQCELAVRAASGA